MKEIKIPKRIIIVRHYTNNSYGTDEYTINGSAMACDNKELKKFTSKYERTKNLYKSNPVCDLEFDNNPISGYKIYPIQNYTKNFEFAKIVHPSGTIINIPIKNIFDLMCTSKIENGIVQDELFFDENMWLVGVNSTRWKRIKELEELAEKARANRDAIKIGSVIITNDGKKKTYCGKLHALYVKKSMDFVVHDASELLHIFWDWDKNVYQITKNIANNNYIISQTVVDVDINKVLNECNEQIINCIDTSDFFDSHNFPFHENTPILFNQKKFKYSDVKYQIIEGDYNSFDKKQMLTLINKLDLIEDNGEYFLPITFRSDNISNYHWSAKHNFTRHLKYKNGYNNNCSNVMLVCVKVQFVDGVLSYPEKLKNMYYCNENTINGLDYKTFCYNSNINLKIGKPYI